MTDLTDAIDAFLAKYPDDVELTWAKPPRKRQGPLAVMVADLVTAAERAKPTATPPTTRTDEESQR